ncbi:MULTISPECIES: hypothetical protein [unclassified Microcoleus]|uniref:hypothetical protein n=1 Tax=unclassified Microcoleus TaxID=2642155 RepID=UPI002FD73023
MHLLAIAGDRNRDFQDWAIDYKAFNYPIGTLTEYFVFLDAKLVLNDLYEMEPKVLSAVEVDVTGLRVF